MTARLLILGGTGEAAELARRAIETFGDRLEVISSLAGRVGQPRALPGRVRSGGFSGGGGLARYLGEQGIDMLIDATHPFAETISANAHAACRMTATPRLVLVRPPWPLPDSHLLVHAADFRAAARVLPGLGRRAFLSFGHGGLAAFANLTGVDFVIRVIEPPQQPLPIPRAVVVTGRPPFSTASEKALLEQHRIDVVVSKNSGGATTPGKITAAIEAEIPVLLIDRPAAEPGPRAGGIEPALQWIGSGLRP